LTHYVFIPNETQSETADFASGAATWRTGRNIRFVFDFGPFTPSCENISSTKPEVHTVLHLRQKRTEPRPMIACKENLVKRGRVVSETREGTETDRQADCNTSHPYRGRRNNTLMSFQRYRLPT